MNRNKELNSEKEKHRKIRKELQTDSQIRVKLQKLYLLNKKNFYKVNDNLMKLVADEELILISYKKLRTNKEPTTPDTMIEMADSMSLAKVKILSKTLLDGTFEWSVINKQMISKPEEFKKRPLRTLNFPDRIVQENIRVILNVIYEPQFQEIETNHGSRPKRSPKTAMTKLQRESKKMIYALEGNVQGTYDNLNQKKMIQILKQKISDNRFLNLIKKSLKQNIAFEKRKYSNIVGSTLFNIYMHEFDRYIVQRLTHISTHLNEIENRTTSGKYTRHYRKISDQVKKAKAKIRKIQAEKTKVNEQNLGYIRNQTLTMRISKKEMLKTSSKRANSLLISFAYSRYAENLIILTNGKRQLLEILKNEITDFLCNDLKLKLDQDKTIITDLKKGKAKYLGFTIFHKNKRIIRNTTKEGRILRQKSRAELTIGVDHERVLNQLVAGKILSEKHFPRSNPIYTVLKPYDVVTKFKQKLERLFDYYYLNITYLNELNRYYYAYKFSCLKTLATRMKVSISQVTMKYGERMEVFSETKSRKKSLLGLIEEKKTKRIVRFPTYGEIHKLNLERKKKFKCEL